MSYLPMFLIPRPYPSASYTASYTPFRPPPLLTVHADQAGLGFTAGVVGGGEGQFAGVVQGRAVDDDAVLLARLVPRVLVMLPVLQLLAVQSPAGYA